MPTKHLWVGNIPIHTKRRDLEHAFSRYGQIKSFHYINGNSTAIVTYVDIEDAVKARERLSGTIRALNGHIVRDESSSSHRGKKM